MSLVAAEIERAGIPTVVIGLLREVIVAVRPPRALMSPYRHGFPLGAPGDAAGQRRVLSAALALLERGDLAPPARVDYEPNPG